MPNYTKLFNSIVTSTIWTEDDKTRIVWITMLALADQNGEVHASIPGLARLSAVTLEDAESSIGKLLSPDKYSRTPDHEGRRIVKIDGGWELLNHAKYRLMASKEDAKVTNAARQKRHRERNATVTPRNASVTQARDIAEAEADTKVKAEAKAEKKPNPNNKRMEIPSVSDILEYGMTLSPPFKDAQKFSDFYESKGWLVGKSPMKSWQASVRTWHRKPDHRQEKRSKEFPEKTTLRKL